MKVVATYHPPSSVVDSVKCTLADNDGSEFLIVAKLNRVDFYSIRPDGLHHENGLEIWGRVRAVRSVPAKHQPTTVLVLTDHPEPELLFVSLSVSRTGTTELAVRKRLSLFERNSRPAEYLHDVVISPSGQCAVVSVYTSRLRVVVMDEGQYDRDFDASIIELNLLSLAFIGVNTLAFLHMDFQQRFQLLARELIINDLQLSRTVSPVLPPAALPEKWFTVEDQPPRLVYVSADDGGDHDFNGGVLVVGGRKILLYDLASTEVAEQNLSKIRRTEKMKRSTDAEEASRAKQKEKEREWKKRKARAIGSPPTTLTYLANQVVYLGSHFGDSQLLRISPTPVSKLDVPTLPVPPSIPTIKPTELGKSGKRRADDVPEGLVVNGSGCYLLQLESFNNLAPIVDAVLVDVDNTGQKEIVTCSGGRNTGSLKVVRRGADFREAAILQGVANVSKVWSLKEKYNDQEHTHLAVSTLERTHVFHFNEEHGTMVSSVPASPAGFETLTCTLTISNILRRTRSGSAQSSYEDSSLVIQVVPRGLLLLEFDPGTGQFSRKGGLWTLDKFADNEIQGRSFSGQEIVAADINASQIVIALSYRWLLQLKLEGERFVKQRGRQFDHEISAVSCAPLDSRNFTNYIAVSFWKSDHVKIIKLVNSRPGNAGTDSLLNEDVSAAAYLNTKACPASLVLAGTQSLVIGAVTRFEKVHVRSVSLGHDSPRCIVHCPSWKAFAIASSQAKPAQVCEAETFTSSVQLFNETSFERLAQFTVHGGEEVTALHYLTVTLAGVPMSFVSAGITTYDAQEPAATAEVKGCIYALTSKDNTVVAAVNSMLVLLRIEGTEKKISLSQIAVWNHNYLISTLVSRGSQLLVGDALTSVSLLNMTESGTELIAKDYGSLWPTCAQMLDEKSLIGANGDDQSDYNIFAFRLQQTELQKLLERDGHYFLGDIVNKFIPGALSSYEVSADVPIEAKQLFFTPTGQIGIIADMSEELSLHMTALQRNLSTYYEQTEGISHSRFRTPKNNRGRSDSEASSFGFLDGDFLERFLLFLENPQALRQIMDGQSEPERLTISAQRIQKVLERLQNTH
ncbi:hypothetical protein ID866_5298 [Astraeus odoratus]|nr:hypothetical protein ID866_5298 [Astraeus odoratus]